MSYKIEIGNFAGPIHKLFELIEDKHYEITDINLAKITGDFLEYLKIIEDKEPRMLADFIAIAAKLILIKSKSLIPNLELTKEEEDDIKDLQNRLNIYKNLKKAEEQFLNLWLAHNISITKNPSLLEKYPIFTPSKDITTNSLYASMLAVRTSIVSLKIQYEKYETVNFEDYIIELTSRIKSITQFQSVVNQREKKEIIILFLALLHLLKDNKISINQEHSFADITILPNN